MILIVTYPKSGTTWMQEIVPLIMSGGDLASVETLTNWERVPWIETLNSSRDSLFERLSPHLFATHFQYSMMPPSFSAIKPKTGDEVKGLHCVPSSAPSGFPASSPLTCGVEETRGGVPRSLCSGPASELLGRPAPSQPSCAAEATPSGAADPPVPAPRRRIPQSRVVPAPRRCVGEQPAEPPPAEQQQQQPAVLRMQSLPVPGSTSGRKRRSQRRRPKQHSPEQPATEKQGAPDLPVAGKRRIPELPASDAVSAASQPSLSPERSPVSPALSEAELGGAPPAASHPWTRFTGAATSNRAQSHLCHEERQRCVHILLSFPQDGFVLVNPGSQTKFLHKFLDGKVANGSWFDHVKGWLNAEDKEHIMYISYEELIMDLKDSVARIAQFLEKPLDAEVIEKIADRCLFKNVKNNNMSNYSKVPPIMFDTTKSTFFRKGIVGDWKNQLTVAEAEYFDAVYKDKMKDVDHKFVWD